MENIEVTEEMQKRILNNVSNKSKLKKSKVVQFPNIKKIAMLVACCVIFVVGSVALPEILKTNTPPPVQVVPDIKTFASKTELEKAVGFECQEPQTGFDITKTTYTAYWGKLAEINYRGENNSLNYRKSEGKDDNSGDYNKYNYTDTLNVDNISVLAKGQSENSISIISWVNDNYSYSIYFENGTTQENAVEIITMVLDK